VAVALLLLSLLSNVALARRSSTSNSKPNVLLITVDDLRPLLGAYGDEAALTPAMDSLIARGVRFDNMHTTKSECAPSRASMLTGKRPDQLRTWAFKPTLRKRNKDLVTLPGLFRANGYRTEAIGKLFDTTNFPPSDLNLVVGYGADRCMNETDVNCSWDRIVMFATINRNIEKQCGKDVTVEVFPNSTLDPLARLEHLAYSYPDSLQESDSDYCAASLATDRIKALAKAGDPFFLAVGFQKPHMPWRYPKSLEAHFASVPDSMFPPDSDDDFWDESSSWSKYSNREMKTYKDWKAFSPMERKRAYYASVSFIDAQVKRIVDSLDNSAAKDNTIIVLWGDHGFHLGEVPGLWGKKTVFEQATRVPFAIVPLKHFGHTANTFTSSPTDSVDIMPTIAAMCGITTNHLDLAGTSLVPLLLDPSSYVRAAAISQYQSHSSKSWEGFSIRTHSHRFVVYLRVKGSRDALKDPTPYRVRYRRKEELYYYNESGDLEHINEFKNKSFRPIRRAMVALLKSGIQDRAWSSLLHQKPFDHPERTD